MALLCWCLQGAPPAEKKVVGCGISLAEVVGLTGLGAAFVVLDYQSARSVPAFNFDRACLVQLPCVAGAWQFIFRKQLSGQIWFGLVSISFAGALLIRSSTVDYVLEVEAAYASMAVLGQEFIMKAQRGSMSIAAQNMAMFFSGIVIAATAGYTFQGSPSSLMANSWRVSPILLLRVLLFGLVNNLRSYVLVQTSTVVSSSAGVVAVVLMLPVVVPVVSISALVLSMSTIVCTFGLFC
eukprot:CAMPEP_0115190880 /NCGR_PEP_ID=MMETSP0270-20121206/12247_1 /TAXON_ID=71861 /ORGANISM="Scrippsiella trochoidea, Strain CCMP3099" /LENGTH=237 /DNA_ID=CAMNT_0002604093 /DNA_START=148 /DNA_END=859 /DNA_ORIENTATION=-